MAINLSAIAQQLYPGLLAVKGKYKEVPLELESVFTKTKSHMVLERSVQARYLGMANVKADGTPVVYDNQAGDRYQYNMEPIGAAIAYVMTQQALEDGLYKSEFNGRNLGLQNSMRSFWNAQSAYLFNTATTYNAAIGGDGQPLLSTAHPVDNGTFRNTTTIPQSLGEASLLSAITDIPTQFVDQAGLYIDARAERLLVPFSLLPTAQRLLNADLRPGTADNDPNVIHTVNRYRIKEIIPCRYFTQQNAWFLTTTVDGLLDIQRSPFDIDMLPDFDTSNLKVKAYERRGFFYNDPRAVYGQFVTS